ncbi:MBOAT family protein [bacterium]|nr:MBOAT family protein [bacterium]
MLFNSLSFILFLPFVFMIYWKLNDNLKSQNIWLLLMSYLFYGWWDWRFLSLIFASTLVDYTIGLKLKTSEKKGTRKTLLVLSLVFNLGVLAVFKYYNFFIDSFNELFAIFHPSVSYNTLDIILPVGISFYTFQTLSYTIDVYKKKLEPTSDFVDFAGYVSFFPQLVAGPIERATNLLPQFQKRRKFDYEKSVLGMRQILWGLFKKMVIADNLAVIVDEVYLSHAEMSPYAIIVGFICFSFQIYCDFSGYSDIAIGTARLFGFDLMKNFNFPYFSKSIADFWRRWHISLTTWFRDYIYFPLGGSRVNKFGAVKNILIVFLVSGFWHGANWTFIFWGGLNALFFLPGMYYPQKKSKNKILLIVRAFWTFMLITFTWVFFRAKSLQESFQILTNALPKFEMIELLQLEKQLFREWKFSWILLLIVCLVVEFLGRKGNFALEKLFPKSKLLRWLSYFIIVLTIGFTMQVNKEGFLYFQF